MRESGPYFYAWCGEEQRVDAFAAAICASDDPSGSCTMSIESLDPPYARWNGSVLFGDVAGTVHAAFTPGTHVEASCNIKLHSGRIVPFDFDCFGEGYERRHPCGPLYARPGDRRDFLPPRVAIAFGTGYWPVEVEATILAMLVQLDIEDMLTRFCTSDASARVMTGACTDLGDWHAPIEACATYHGDASSIARDLALSWVHLHDGDKVERAAGMSTAALRARVEAATPGTRVAVAGDAELALKHGILERAAAASMVTRHLPIDAGPRGARVAISGDAELTREAILKAYETPPGALLEALEACALPDDRWRAVEPRALEAIEATKQGAPTVEVDVTSRKHIQFIERHAPYRVRRLPNGGVILTTHPYRTLWPLWADALWLLGIAL